MRTVAILAVLLASAASADAPAPDRTQAIDGVRYRISSAASELPPKYRRLIAAYMSG